MHLDSGRKPDLLASVYFLLPQRLLLLFFLDDPDYLVYGCGQSVDLVRSPFAFGVLQITFVYLVLAPQRPHGDINLGLSQISSVLDLS